MTKKLIHISLQKSGETIFRARQIRKQRHKKGFTLVELIVCIVIILILSAVAVPLVMRYIETSGEATDIANARTACVEVVSAAMADDKTSPLYKRDGLYMKRFALVQGNDGWASDMENVIVGGVAYRDQVHWKPPQPKAGGYCKVYFQDNALFINWGGEDHINSISAEDFLTQNILRDIVSDNYKHTVINSNEPEHQNEGTKKFMDYARENGFDLKEDYGAKTWQIYVKEQSGNTVLQKPAIYWSTLELNKSMVEGDTPVYVPVMGYRDGKYDVYRAKVVKYNTGTANEYLTLENNFAKVADGTDGLGGTATFQYSDYDSAKAAYDTLLTAFEANGTVKDSDLTPELKK